MHDEIIEKVVQDNLIETVCEIKVINDYGLQSL
jgi:hypothetical protein